MKGRQLFFLSVFLSFLISTTSVMAHTVILRAMRVQDKTNKTQVTFYLSASTRFHTLILHNPNRFVIDLNRTKTYQRLRIQNFNTSPIKNFKYAVHGKGMLRIVFGLKNAIRPQVVVLPSDRHHSARLQIIFYHDKTIRHRASHAIKRASIKLKSFRDEIRHSVENEIQKETVQSEPQAQTQTILSDADFEKDNTHHRDIVIVIDPGHGGKDPGAIGQHGTHEKNVVLSISKLVQHDINKQPGFHALLTRSGDYYLTLRQRLAIARKDKADMFIAIHADTWRNKQARGVSVFALSQRGATSEAARWLATRENASELMGGVELQDKSHLLKSVLINLSQSATIRSSLQIGEDVIQSVRPITPLHHSRVEQAAFVVLKSPDIPSLLVETGFLSNPREEQKLRSETYQRELASAIMRGIDRYFTYYPPRNTWLSYWRSHSHLARYEHNDYRL